MKKIFVLFFFFSLQACENQFCTSENYDFFVDGVPVCNDSNFSFSPEDISKTFDIVAKQVERKYPELENIRERMLEKIDFIYFSETGFAQDCSKIYLGDSTQECELFPTGLNYGGKEIFLGSIYSYCLATTSLGHELLHSVEYAFFDSGSNHERPFFFEQFYGYDINLVKETIEHQIFLESLEALPACHF